MKKFWKTFKETVWVILGIIYYPIYAIAWLLHKVARLLLAIAYFFMFQGHLAKDIITHLFKKA